MSLYLSQTQAHFHPPCSYLLSVWPRLSQEQAQNFWHRHRFWFTPKAFNWPSVSVSNQAVKDCRFHLMMKETFYDSQHQTRGENQTWFQMFKIRTGLQKLVIDGSERVLSLAIWESRWWSVVWCLIKYIVCSLQYSDLTGLLLISPSANFFTYT